MMVRLMSKKKRRPDLEIRGFGSQPLLVNISKAEAMMRRRRWDEARNILQSLNEQYPNQVEVLTSLAILYNLTKDFLHYQLVCTQLSQLKPDDPEITLMLAGAYMSNLRPISALRAFEQFLTRWPDHPEAPEARKTIAQLEEIKNNIIAEVGLSEQESLNLAVLHETAQSCLEQGKYTEGRQALDALLRIRPHSIPDLNNLSLICFLESDLEQAMATAEQVLNLEPNNIHALSNLTRYRCLSGQIEAAKSIAERLKAIASDTPDSCVKKVEALSFLGDDQSILDIFKEVQPAEVLDSTGMNSLLYHLAGVAAMRLGQDRQARQYWQQALKIEPGFELAKENLEDSQQLVGQRHAPWAFTLNSWITPQAFLDLAILEDAEKSEDGSGLREAARNYLQKHPEVAALVPLLLDRGDLKARQFALTLAVMADTEQMQLALRDFALSQCGSDRMRQQAAQVVSQAGLFPPGLVRMWLEGEWREVILLGFEIHNEPVEIHQPQVEKLAREAVMAFKQGQIDKSQRLLQNALKIEPDAVDLLYNLAGTYECQGQSEKALEIVQKLYQQNPDYIFGRISFAKIQITKGELDEAEALLQPLMSQKRFHYSQFDAFCNTRIELYMAQKNPEAARAWLEMWAMMAPHTPALDYWRQRLDKAKPQKQISAERVWRQM
ncbi:MAG TPA: hypothetical protein DDZ80_01780 [Cyanobacteria bacterium UBA8803]|nr:hypothetical protein [Cyanobacteria bacterium UBA9273]HBL57326.1 hypothetical protein [Cyanobacteria bacterium UBA8803]